MSPYHAGSLCENCFGYGLRHFLKSFYINLDEQIIKCESSRCMFPYMRKPVYDPYIDTKQSESNILNLDQFIEDSVNQIDSDGTVAKSEPQCPSKMEDMPILLDFSSVFTNNTVKTEDKAKPIICATTSTNSCKAEDVKVTSIIEIKKSEQCTSKMEDTPILFDFSQIFTDDKVKAEDKIKPISCATTSSTKLCKAEDMKVNSIIKNEALFLQPSKARISRCLSNVKSSSYPKKSDSRISKSKRVKNGPVLVLDPRSGKSMRPLDIIKYYMKD